MSKAKRNMIIFGFCFIFSVIFWKFARLYGRNRKKKRKRMK